MSNSQKSIVWPLLLGLVVLLGALAFVAGSSRRFGPKGKKLVLPPGKSQVTQTQSNAAIKPRPRNLSLQPEAFNLSRRLGQRFSPSKREKSILVGTLTIGSIQRVVQIFRTQADDGEQVEIRIAGSPGVLTWDAGGGARATSGRASGSDRELIERLVLDSPDQFVLAQLRGAGYYTVARNVRPVEADEKYAGPLWNIVRVQDPERDAEKRPQSAWRLYYLNTNTGLIDKVVSEFQGDKVETAFQAWSTQAGEKWPTRIVWTRQGTSLMDLSVQSLTVITASSGGGQ